MAPKLALFSLLATLGLVGANGIYTGKSPVLQVSVKNYDSLIAQSNHTSIVEFYAPWCGHCQNLKPAYEKAAQNLAGLAKVAAVNCDEDENRPLCSQFGVQGFPTLKIVKPGKKPGRPAVEDYNGARSAKAIVDAVIDKIPNHVQKLQDDSLENWLKDTTTAAKAILFTEKGTTAAMFKALAIDFLGQIDFGQVRSKQRQTAERYGVTKFPTVVLISGQDDEPISYQGDMKKDKLIGFLGKVASPNPDPAPKKAKAIKSAKKPRESTTSTAKASAFSSASEAHKSSDFEDYLEHASTVVLDDDTPLESPIPIVEQEKPMVVPEVAPPIPDISTATKSSGSCLTPTSGSCVLILLPIQESTKSPQQGDTEQALTSFAEVSARYHKRKAGIFPFYSIPAENQNAATIRSSLGLKTASELEIVAINMKRGWWKHYTAQDFNPHAAERFVDDIKLGDGPKQKLPSGFLSDTPKEATKDGNTASEDTDATMDEGPSDASPDAQPQVPYHGEL